MASSNVTGVVFQSKVTSSSLFSEADSSRLPDANREHKVALRSTAKGASGTIMSEDLHV